MNLFLPSKKAPKDPIPQEKPPHITCKAGANIERFLQPHKIVRNKFSLFFKLSTNRLKINNYPKKTLKFLRKEIPNQAKSDDKIPVRIVRSGIEIILFAPNRIQMFCL